MKSQLIGAGSPTSALTEDEVRELCREALGQRSFRGQRVLVLIPDHTRHAPIDRFFRILYALIGEEVASFDVLVATGTHQPMELERIYRHVGITAAEHRDRYAKVRFFNHVHDDRSSLELIGTIAGEEISRLSGGLFRADIPVRINKRALDCDHILMVTPVVPHEAMGFAGGDKYFFPGIAGVEVVETFHWLAAVITNPLINGVKETPTRRVIDRAAEFLKVPRTCFAFVVNQEHEIACLYAGDPREAWSRAADCSAELHITYLDRPCRRVLGVVPENYEEIWVAGKAMYKLEPIVADGGELIIYGPHIREISFTHGEAVRRIGYHVRDYFVGQWERFEHEPKLILAHSTNVRGTGTYQDGVESPRIRVTLATSIPAEVCARINLGHADPAGIDPDAWEAAADPDLLVVRSAGQVLYRLRAPASV